MKDEASLACGFVVKILSGAGQIYGGAKVRGIFLIAITSALFLMIVFAVFGFLLTENATTSRTLVVVMPTATFLMIVVGIYGIVDAYKITKRYNAQGDQTVAHAENRKSWFSAFLSSLFPGIGQFYNKQVLKGFAFITAMVVSLILEVAFTPLFILGLLVFLIGIKDAFDSAEAMNGSGERFLHQDKSILLFFVIMLTLQAIPFSNIVKGHVIKAYKTPSTSMNPTLQVGDHFSRRNRFWVR